ncbi:uncharacterized protein METZ01_LOCUS207450, partial [marine metagenome]
ASIPANSRTWFAARAARRSRACTNWRRAACAAHSSTPCERRRSGPSSLGWN